MTPFNTAGCIPRTIEDAAWRSHHTCATAKYTVHYVAKNQGHGAKGEYYSAQRHTVTARVQS
jgi:hypothetical protein